MDKKNEIMNIIFNQITELIFVFYENGDIFEANPYAKMKSGYGEDIFTTNISNIFPTVFSDNHKKIVIIEEKLKDKDEFNKFETVAYCCNQTCFPVILNYSRIILGESIIGICHAVNISEHKAAIIQKKRALNEVSEANKVKDELIANVTHELRTPLNGIKGLLESLKETKIDNEQITLIDIIIHCCDNMTKIINDILDMSKIEAGKMTIEKKEFDFNRFIKNTIDINSHIISAKGLKFLINIGKGIPVKVIGDELRLGQIINNFLSNAVKFTTVGSITLEVVKTYELQDEIELFFMINDTGIGISEQNIQKLFIPFSQLDGSITRQYGGTGLGLSICRQLVDMMGGNIQVESEEGKGSTFSFAIKLELPKSSADGIKHISNNWNSKIHHNKINEYKEPKDILYDSLEKLSISVEMGTWERAEALASYIKNMIPDEYIEIYRTAFRIVLAVRKCEYEKTIQYIKELQDMFDELDLEGSSIWR